jgi:RHS repeat-associated protein
VSFSHDANGNNTFEGTRTRVAYNEINLPQQVQLLGGRGIKNMYAADGRKLKTEAKQGNEYVKEGTKTYSGNLVFDINDELDYILFNEGRILYNVDDSTFKYEYHLKDHVGSTRVAFVPTAQGMEVVQENNYYPFGAPISDLSWTPKSTNRYLREGKEYVSDFDWNKYDFTGRTFDSRTGQALQVDPMAEKYYGSSPYALWVNNPVRVIDPTGKWIVGTDGKPVTYINGQWSTNTSADVRRVGNAMMITEAGKNHLNDILLNSQKISIKLNPDEIKTGNRYDTGVTNNKAGKDSKNNFIIEESKITIYEGSIKALTSESAGNNPLKELTVDEAIGVIAGHEKGHTEEENIKQSFENKKEGTNHDVEARPLEIENEILDELKNKRWF